MPKREVPRCHCACAAALAARGQAGPGMQPLEKAKTGTCSCPRALPEMGLAPHDQRWENYRSCWFSQKFSSSYHPGVSSLLVPPGCQANCKDAAAALPPSAPAQDPCGWAQPAARLHGHLCSGFPRCLCLARLRQVLCSHTSFFLLPVGMPWWLTGSVVFKNEQNKI